MRHTEMSEICPGAVPGTTISTADTYTGIAVTFTTSEPANVAELRRRVQAMARMHEQHRVRGVEPQGEEHPHHGMPMHKAMMQARATVDEVQNGARVVLEPKDPADLAELRSHVRMMVDQERRAAGEGHEHACPMMERMMRMEEGRDTPERSPE